MARRYKDWKLKDFQDYYNEHYQGKSRKQVLEKDGGFYNALYGKGLIEKVIPRKNKKWTNLSLKELKKLAKR